MRLVDADIGDAELRRLYDVWNLAMAPAEGREIAAIDKNMRMLKLMQSFLKSLPTADTAAANEQLETENGQLRAVILQDDPNFFKRKCRSCGCDWNHPCNGNDYWVEDDLCSACAKKLHLGGF